MRAPSEILVPRPLKDVEVALKDVVDAELGVNIVDLGLLYGLEYGPDNALRITMTLTSPACALTEEIEEQVGRALKGVVDEWHLAWVWTPRWGPDRITEDGREQMRAWTPCSTPPRTSRTAPSGTPQ
ncbi:metal-sulfur cluster assembly factor [Sinomonas sp. B1-1]|uniref:metal-sulfur cluster assembly factor n=1 Tax=Sinomonas sp. B1-1 TaxID=3141454 RepID=UPI003D2747AD